MYKMIAKWNFLLGTWKSDPNTEIGGTEGMSNRAIFSQIPSDSYIQMDNYTVDGEGMDQGRSLATIFFDKTKDQFILKSIYGFGFVVNYEGITHSDNEIKLKSRYVDAVPQGWEDKQFMFQLTKENENKFTIHLQMGDGNEYETFWKATYNKDKI